MKTFIALITITLSLTAQTQDWDVESYDERFQPVAEVVAPIQIVKANQKPKVIKAIPRAQLLAQQRIKQIQREESDEEQEADEGDIGYDEYPAHRGYGRPKLVEDDDELSDEIKFRLMIARMKAMEAYRNKWA